MLPPCPLRLPGNPQVNEEGSYLHLLRVSSPIFFFLNLKKTKQNQPKTQEMIEYFKKAYLFPYEGLLQQNKNNLLY